MKKAMTKKPKCPKCVSPTLAGYYRVGIMRRVYTRKGNGFRAIGYVCEKHCVLLLDKDLDKNVYKNDQV